MADLVSFIHRQPTIMLVESVGGYAVFEMNIIYEL